MEKICIVTGAHGAIGKAIVSKMLKQKWQTHFVVRKKDQLDEVTKFVNQAYPNGKAIGHCVDLASIVDVKRFCDDWQRQNKQLHALINNAATSPVKKAISHDGIEIQYAVNVLAYYWLSIYLMPTLESTQDSRVVNVASHYAGGLDLNDLEFVKRTYDNNDAYKQSKQANRMLNVALSKKYPKVSFFSCHPGVVSSGISNSLGFGGSESAEQGATTPVYCALNATHNETGKFFSRSALSSDSFASDTNSIAKLLEDVQRRTSELEKKHNL